MSKRSLLSVVTASLMAYSLLVFPSLAIGQDKQDSQIVTFEKATGGTFYALSLKPNVPVKDDRGTDVLVLFDTSASQTGLYRDDAMESLKSMLSSFGEDVRVKVFSPARQGPLSRLFGAALDGVELRAVWARFGL